MITQTLKLFTALISGLNDKMALYAMRKMQESVNYMIEENRILREQLRNEYGVKRIKLTDLQRRRLAVKAVIVGKDTLRNIATFFKLETILGWHRKLVAKKYDGSANVKRAGRPPVSPEKIEQVLRMAKANLSWGYTRIPNVMKHLKLPVSRSTVKRILDAHGIVPDPKLKHSLRWKEFTKSHMHVLAATDFFSVEVLTKSGLIRFMVLFVIYIKTRRVEIAGIKRDPDGEWMKQMARNLIDCVDGFLLGKQYLIHDRDPLFCKGFVDYLEMAGLETIKLPPFSPNLNAYAEPFCTGHKVRVPQ